MPWRSISLRKKKTFQELHASKNGSSKWDKYLYLFPYRRRRRRDIPIRMQGWLKNAAASSRNSTAFGVPDSSPLVRQGTKNRWSSEKEAQSATSTENWQPNDIYIISRNVLFICEPSSRMQLRSPVFRCSTHIRDHHRAPEEPRMGNIYAIRMMMAFNRAIRISVFSLMKIN